MDNDFSTSAPRPGFDLHITLAMLWSLLVQTVLEYGDDHHGDNNGNGCAYVVKTDGFRLIPSCIIGQVFHRLGVLRVLVTPGYAGGTSFNYGTCDVLSNYGALRDILRERLETFGITFDDDAWAIAVEAQGLQDAGESWGSVLDQVAQVMVDKEYVPKWNGLRDHVTAALG